jgi:hypothetical protein
VPQAGAALAVLTPTVNPTAADNTSIITFIFPSPSWPTSVVDRPSDVWFTKCRA